MYKGKAKPKADVTLIMSDETFATLAEGKVRFIYLTAISILTIELPARRSEGIHDWQTEDEGQYDDGDEA